MAKPAFIYAFDILGPERFIELCGLIFGARFKGFLLGGVGSDGGEDGTVDASFGEWHTESSSAILSELIQAEQLVIFQFKHKMVGRLGGQKNARADLLKLYKCGSKKPMCELHRSLVQQKRPDVYVLVTNVEVNAQFREKFIQQCKKENPDIKLYQIVGLDELEMWITRMPELRHLYFPTIFGSPRFELRVNLDFASPTTVIPPYLEEETSLIAKDVLCVSVLNVGLVPSYLSSIKFQMIVGEGLQACHCRFSDLGDSKAVYNNSVLGEALEPGRKQQFFFTFNALSKMMRKLGPDVFLDEVQVSDEIGNIYTETVPEEIRDKLQTWVSTQVSDTEL